MNSHRFYIQLGSVKSYGYALACAILCHREHHLTVAHLVACDDTRDV